MHMRMFPLLLLGYLFGLGGGPLHAAAPLGTIREVLALTPAEAAAAVPVAVEGVLLINDTFRSTFFIHDGQTCCYLRIPPPLRGVLQRGHRYRVEGVTNPGGYQPIIFVEKLADLGPGVEPEPLRLDAGNLFRTVIDAQWVEVEGVVESSSLKEGGPSLDLRVDGWLLEVIFPREIPETVTLPWHLVGLRVKIRGVAGGNFNDQRQLTRRFLRTPTIGHVTVLNAAPPGLAALVTADALLQAGLELDDRVVVRGTVTHVLEGSAVFVRDATGTLRILTAQSLNLQPGDLMEAEGFPAMESLRPALRAVSIRKLGSGPPPVPRPLEAAQPLGTVLHHELVRTQGSLLAVSDGADGFVLQCESGGRIFECLLDKRLAPQLPAGLIPGSTLLLTGLVELLPSRFFYMQDWIGGFRLHLRGSGDISLIASPPWWNATRLLWMLGAVFIVGAGAMVWVHTLRKTVKAQTRLIGRKLEREAVLEERQRIAREMHDTFQQSLAGAGHLLDDALRKLNGGGHTAASPLQLARQMLRHCREEARTSIADLRSLALENRTLPEALEELLRPPVEAAGVRFEIEIEHPLPELPSGHPHAMLRIAQEAVSNALQHAQPRVLHLSLAGTATTVTLTIRDDGCGFVAAAADPWRGHFGILGMKERALKLEGRIGITSTPGAGTVVTATFPLHLSSLDKPFLTAPA